MPGERDFLRTDATVEFQGSLDRNLHSAYPPINSVKTLEALKEKRTVYASFRLSENPLAPHIILAALGRAIDPSDAAFCAHAAKHGNFPEVVEDLSAALRIGKMSVRTNSHLMNLRLEAGETRATVHRLIAEAPKRKRATYRPGPLQLHLELEEKLSTLKLAEEKYSCMAKVIRKAAARYGIPFAIITCIYGGMTAKPIVELFDNKDVKATILAGREKAGVRKPKIPAKHYENHTELHHTILRIRDLLVVEEDGEIKPRYNAGEYLQALQELGPEYQYDFSPELTNFIPAHDMVTPRAVFFGLDEVAQGMARKEFADPYRRRYIDERYGSYYTTRMVTAYFDSHIDPKNTHFQEMFIKNRNQVADCS